MIIRQVQESKGTRQSNRIAPDQHQPTKIPLIQIPGYSIERAVEYSKIKLKLDIESQLDLSSNVIYIIHLSGSTGKMTINLSTNLVAEITKISVGVAKEKGVLSKIEKQI